MGGLGRRTPESPEVGARTVVYEEASGGGRTSAKPRFLGGVRECLYETTRNNSRATPTGGLVNLLRPLLVLLVREGVY